MTITSALRDLNSALLDLQLADYDTYGRPLKRMSTALASPELKPINDELKAGVNFDEFLASAQSSRGIGNDRLNWPTEIEKELGLTIELIERAANDPNWFLDFAHRYYSSTSAKIIATIQKVTTAVFIPFNRDYASYVEGRNQLSGAVNGGIAAATGTAVGVGTFHAVGEAVIDPSSWTGVPSRTARLTAVRGQIEAAHSAIEFLIKEIALDDGNGGPLLDEHSEALEVLRQLHRVIGDLIKAIDNGQLNDSLGEGFAAEIARYGGRWLASLRDDPARYFVGLTAFASLTACGLGDWAGFAAGAALGVPRKSAKK